jgi:DNA-binding NarL/FixJ family response regulator
VDLDFSAAVRGAKELIAANPKTALIVLHVSENEEEIAGWAEVGVSGFLSRQASVDDLVRTVESAAHGETVCPPSVAAVLLRRVTALADQLRRAGERQSSLTAREHEIVQLIDEGLSNKAIAHRLQIELPTVKNHVHHILQKLDANGRGQAAAMLRGEEAADR